MNLVMKIADLIALVRQVSLYVRALQADLNALVRQKIQECLGRQGALDFLNHRLDYRQLARLVHRQICLRLIHRREFSSSPLLLQS